MVNGLFTKVGRKLTDETILSVLVLTVFFFLATNFAPQILGLIFAAFTITYLIFLQGGFFKPFKFTVKRVNFNQVLTLVGLGIVGWFGISSILGNVILGANVPLQSVIPTLAAQISPPIISEIPLLKLFVFGIVIPFAETFFFFGVLLAFLALALRVNTNTLQGQLLIGSALGVAFAAFHIFSQGASDFALLADFVFAVISSVLVFRNKELIQAALLHVVANTAIIASQLGLF